MNLARLDHQNKNELSMIEVAYEILAESNQVYDFNDLLAEIQNYLSLSDDQIAEQMVTFYTELNTDGSFISLGENRWGLRAWYAIDAINEAIVASIDDDDLKAQHKAKRRKKANAFNEDMIDYNDDDYDEDYNEDREAMDEDSDDEEDNELKDYKMDLEELGDDAPEEALEDGLEGDLTIISEDDLEESSEDDF